MTGILIVISFCSFVGGLTVGWLFGLSEPNDDLRYVEGHVDGYRKAMRDTGGDWT